MYNVYLPFTNYTTDYQIFDINSPKAIGVTFKFNSNIILDS